MYVLFVSRKKSSDIGGLSRFKQELYSRFPEPKYLLTITKPSDFFKIPYRKLDLIHLCDATLFPIGVMIKSIIHKPLTVTVHGLDVAYPNRIYQSMLRFASPKAHAVILDSNPVKKLLKNFPVNIKRTVVINPGISFDHFLSDSVSRFPPASARLSANIDRSARWRESLPRLPPYKKRLILLTVGNLVRRKSHVWFIKNVFSKLSNNFIYFIVGDGPERESILSTINYKLLTDRVFLLGQINDYELGQIYRSSDIYICPNQKKNHDFEGFGIAAGEAAAMGLPVVASRVDGIPEVIHDKKNGLLVEPTSEGFIKCIDTLINPNKRRQLGRRGKKYTREQFDWKKTIDQYVKLFQEVISKT